MALALLIVPLRNLPAKDPVDYVDPFIGTGRQGKDFPGATVPFSMVKLSPDTVVSGPTSYYFSDKTIMGFSFTHLGGADGGELGNVLVTPTTGPLQTYGGERGKPGSGSLSSYSKDTEKASAGYYAVTLDTYKTRAEATAAPHSGMLRLTFPENKQSRVQIDLSHRIDGTSTHQTVQMVNDHAIEGQIDCTSHDGGWRFGAGINYTVYYHVEFNRLFKKSGVWSATLPPVWSATPPVEYGKNHSKSINDEPFIAACKAADVLPDCRAREGATPRILQRISHEAGRSCAVKAGLSFVSVDGARAQSCRRDPRLGF